MPSRAVLNKYCHFDGNVSEWYTAALIGAKLYNETRLPGPGNLIFFFQSIFDIRLLQTIQNCLAACSHRFPPDIDNNYY
jgi:hypothetical protein